MPYYRVVGDIPPKRHTQHRNGDGGLYAEELMGAEGFGSDSSLLYHRDIPSAIVSARPWDLPDLRTTPNLPLLPRHLRLPALVGEEGAWKAADAVTSRRLVLGNQDVRINYVAAGQASPYYVNGLGDECVYVESGRATVETVFGELIVGEGDYVVIPRATTHRWVPDSPQAPLSLYIVEANSRITLPRKYLSRFGQLLEHAPYCERDLRAPAAPLLVEDDKVEVYLKHRGAGGRPAGTVHVHATHPFDVVGWDGCLYPFVFSVSDYEPITGRIHQPPPSHQVFEATNFVICNFVPRKVDYHPLAVPVPYYHSNADCDEVMFYCGAKAPAREGSSIERCSVSLHPGGFPHGPQPGVVQRSLGAEFVDELAIMVDTFGPLEIGEGGTACEDDSYAWSWAPGQRS